MFGANVDFVGDSRVIFDIDGNKHLLIVHVSYPNRRLLVKLVGTHADYGREAWGVPSKHRAGLYALAVA